MQQADPSGDFALSQKSKEKYKMKTKTNNKGKILEAWAT